MRPPTQPIMPVAITLFKLKPEHAALNRNSPGAIDGLASQKYIIGTPAAISRANTDCRVAIRFTMVLYIFVVNQMIFL